MAPLQSPFRLHHPASAVFQLSFLISPLALLLISIAQVVPSLSITSFVSAADFMPVDSPAAGSSVYKSATYKYGSSSLHKSDYARSNEVQQQCEPHLKDLATDPSFWRQALARSEKRWPSILDELTFQNGKWKEAPNNNSKASWTRPLMPFVGRDLHFSYKESWPQLQGLNSAEYPSVVIKSPVHLVSNWVTDVQLPFNGVPPSNSKGNMVNVSVVLEVGISSQGPLPSFSSHDLLLQGGFEISPAFSRLAIRMEGVYAELKNGERLLCLLGSTKLPSRGKNESHPWDWLINSANGPKLPSLNPRDSRHKSTVNMLTFPSPSLSYDSKIMAVLHFPKELSLTTRAVLGRLQSLQASTHPNYFDPIHLFSQLGASAHYHFKSGDLVRSACDSPRQPGELSPSKNLYRGNSFCTVVQRLLPYQWVDILPNWNCTLSTTTCMKLGPFQSSPQVQTMVDGVFNGAKLQVQGIRCVDYPEEDGSWSANMSAVFRAVLPSQNQYMAFEQTSLDGLTLAAEGRWNSKSGELCMVGCRGGMISSSSSQASIKEACDTKIRIYIPLTLSLIQRSTLEGSVSITASASSDDFSYPLSFHVPHYPRMLPFDLAQKMTYEYTRIKEAGALRTQDKPMGLRDSIMKSLLEYPSADHSGVFMDVLSDDLSLQTLAITNPDSSKAGPHLQHSVKLNMVAIEDRVKVPWMEFAAPENAAHDELDKKVDEQKSFYRVATDLQITDKFGSTLMVIAAEGVYDPTVGRSYLLSCRKVNATWKTFQENAESLEEGLDCKIVLKVEYPPTNSRWFMINPTVLLTVSSTRAEDDPFFFPKITLKTFPILYKRQREEILSRKSLETGLSILTLSLILCCIVSQLMYVTAHADSSAPYISLVMLGVQAVDFSVPLITGMEASFGSTSSNSDGRVPLSVSTSMTSASDGTITLWREGRRRQAGGYMVNILTLANFLLTLRLVQKVYESRIRMLSRRPLESWRVPSDRKVLAMCAGVHALGFIIVLINHSIGMSKRPISWSMSMYDWERILKEYYGLVQDLFLLPQVVGNHLWIVKGKPLRKLFYMGVTVLRLLPHIYNALRPPVFYRYSADAFRYANPSSDFYFKMGDIAIPVFAVLLAILIYIQQRWSNGLKGGKVLRLQGSCKPTRMGSEVYERLPSETFQAEMVGSVTARHDDLIQHDNGHHIGDGGNR